MPGDGGSVGAARNRTSSDLYRAEGERKKKKKKKKTRRARERGRETRIRKDTYIGGHLEQRSTVRIVSTHRSSHAGFNLLLLAPNGIALAGVRVRSLSTEPVASFSRSAKIKSARITRRNTCRIPFQPGSIRHSLQIRGVSSFIFDLRRFVVVFSSICFARDEVAIRGSNRLWPHSRYSLLLLVFSFPPSLLLFPSTFRFLSFPRPLSPPTSFYFYQHPASASLFLFDSFFISAF